MLSDIVRTAFLRPRLHRAAWTGVREAGRRRLEKDGLSKGGDMLRPDGIPDLLSISRYTEIRKLHRMDPL
jgi:hypothetical protein